MPQALCEVYAPTSQVLADDAELLQLYADAGVHTEGLAFEVVTAELVSQEGGRVVLRSPTGCRPISSSMTSGAVQAEKEGLARGDLAGRARSCAGRLGLAVRLNGGVGRQCSAAAMTDGASGCWCSKPASTSRAGTTRKLSTARSARLTQADSEGELRHRKDRAACRLPSRGPG